MVVATVVPVPWVKPAAPHSTFHSVSILPAVHPKFDEVAAFARGRLSRALCWCFGNRSRHMVVLQWVWLCADLRNFGWHYEELTPFMVSEYWDG